MGMISKKLLPIVKKRIGERGADRLIFFNYGLAETNLIINFINNKEVIMGKGTIKTKGYDNGCGDVDGSWTLSVDGVCGIG